MTGIVHPILTVGGVTRLKSFALFCPLMADAQMVGSFEKVPRTPESTVAYVCVHKGVHPDFVDAHLVTGRDRWERRLEATTYFAKARLSRGSMLKQQVKHKGLSRIRRVRCGYSVLKYNILFASVLYKGPHRQHEDSEQASAVSRCPD
jgi:hypothetical protein